MADSDDPTRTAEEPAGAALPQPPSRRLAAPLQDRDPDRYEILGEHGRGGLGIVSRAHDKELGRDVAIKELISRGDIGEIRFLRETLITARLEHPGIVPIHEAGRWPDGTPFYVMKLVAGRSLKELLAARTTIEARLELLPHVIAVADAVAYAHKRRIIHRDLKASNVIAGDFGETVVIDWGLAKDLATADAASSDEAPYRTAPVDDLTTAGGPVGTPMYMAPEQQRGEPVDQRADVFAIGMMLWQLCSLAQVPPPDPRARDRALLAGGIHQIQFDPHSRDLLIVAKSGQVRAVKLSVHRRIPWDTLTIDALNVAYSKDGEMLAFVCRDGGSWFYSFSADQWVYGRDHAADVPWGYFRMTAPARGTDRSGVVVVRGIPRTFSRSER